MQRVNIWICLWGRKLAMTFHLCLVRNFTSAGRLNAGIKPETSVRVRAPPPSAGRSL